MLGLLGAPELIIIGLIVILLFGVGKISGLGRELGSSIQQFRKAVKDPDAEAKEEAAKLQAAAPPPAPVQQPPVQYVAPAPQQQPPPAQPAQSADNKNSIF